MFQLIAGPCVIESEGMVLSIAAQMKAITDRLGIPYTFKASLTRPTARRSAVSEVRALRRASAFCRRSRTPMACLSARIFMSHGKQSPLPKWRIFCRFRLFSAGRPIC